MTKALSPEALEIAAIIGEAIARAYLEGKLDGQKEAPEDGASKADQFDKGETPK